MVADPGEWMVIGTVAGPFGVRGEAKITLNTDFPDRFRALSVVFLGPDRRRLDVVHTRRHKGQVLLKLGGIDSPEAVRALGGQEVTVPRSQAVPLPEGHYYLDELVGTQVSLPDGRALGEVVDVLRTGGNDVFVVKAGTKELLIPSITDAVRRLDVPARVLVVEPWVLEVEE